MPQTGSLHRRHGIRARLLATYLLLTVLIGTLMVIVVAVVARANREDKINDLIRATRAVAVGSLNPYIGYDFVTLRQYVNAMSASPEVRYVVVTDSNGLILAHTDEAREGEMLEHPVAHGALNDSSVAVSVGKDNIVERAYIDVAVPVTFAGEQVGLVMTRFDFEEQVRTARRLYYLLGTALGGWFVLGTFLFIMLTSRTIIQPLQRLTDGARAIAMGQLEYRVDLRSGDELQTLAEAFDTMAAHLAEQRREIERWNAELARRVNQRTEEIASLYETGQELVTSLELEEVLETTLHAALTLSGATGGRIFLVDPATGQLATYAARVIGDGLTVTRDALIEAAFAREQTVGLADTPGAQLSSAPQAGNSWPDGLALPLRRGETSVGVLSVHADTAEHFLQHHVTLLSILASQAAIAIENAQIFTETRELAELLERRVQHRTRALEEAQAELVRSERLAAMGRLAASIAHEVNNPLQAIRPSLELVGDAIDPKDPNRVYYEVIVREIDQIAEIVQRMLHFYRPSSEGVVLLNVNDLIEEVLVLTGKHLKHERVHLEYRLGEGLPHIQADGSRLKQVFLNIILNAVEAMPGGGELRIETSSNATGVAITFADTGHGIAASDLPRIFDPVYTTKARGTGQGLAICQAIVAEHGGRIEVVSEPKRGTTFTVWLPGSGR